MHIRLRHHLLISIQYRGGGPRVRDKRGCDLAVKRRGEPILVFPLKFFLGELSYWDDISPKRGKYKLKLLSAYYRGW